MSNTAIANFYKSSTHDYERAFSTTMKSLPKRKKSMLVSKSSLMSLKKQESK